MVREAGDFEPLFFSLFLLLTREYYVTFYKKKLFWNESEQIFDKSTFVPGRYYRRQGAQFLSK